MVYSISLLSTWIPNAWINRVDVNKTSEWGNNPATLGAVATAVAAAAIIVAWLSLRESKTQRRILEAEIAARMRPWVGLFDFGFDGVKGDKAVLRVLLRNFGPLPAQQARLKLAFEPGGGDSDKRPDPFIWEEPVHKVLMPGEDGNYPINLIRFPEVMEWISDARDVIISGTFEYALAKNEFQSQFQATLWFSRNQSQKNWFSRNRSSDVAVPSNWRNTSAT